MNDEGQRRADSLGPKAATRQEYWLGFYEQCCGRLRGYFARYVKCPDDVDDLMQAVFLDLIMHGGDVQNPQAYLFTVARHQLFFYRRCQRKGVLAEQILSRWAENDLTAAEHHNYDSDPLSELSHREMCKIVDFLVENLSPALREALQLRYRDGLRLRAAAARAGCSCTALKKRLERAKRSLGECLTM